jgi:hypothetical protein
MGGYNTVSGDNGHRQTTIMQDLFKGFIIDILVFHLLPPLSTEKFEDAKKESEIDQRGISLVSEDAY